MGYKHPLLDFLSIARFAAANQLEFTVDYSAVGSFV
jgi:hypothetical protein